MLGKKLKSLAFFSLVIVPPLVVMTRLAKDMTMTIRGGEKR